ncbi:enoyl-CoA hydratase/isomerase family protein [Chloroflexota bacterium]
MQKGLEMDQKYNTIIYDKEERIVKITLNRPESRNSISKEMSKELNSALLHAKEDKDVGAIIITGAGSAFCSGIDLKSFHGMTGLENLEFLHKFYSEMIDIQTHLGKPTIAAINGPVLAAGCSIAFSCDVIIASEKARIGYPEINVGLMPALHLVMVPRLISRHRGFELLFTGDIITAEQANSLGLINRAVPHDKLDQEAFDLAKKFASKSPLIVKIMKDRYYQLADVEYCKAVSSVIDASGVLVTSEDTKEGMKAFAEKRPPIWKGK